MVTTIDRPLISLALIKEMDETNSAENETMKEYRQRKQNRLTGYDYSQNGAYFITFCTYNREPVLWIATDNIYDIRLSPDGNAIRIAIEQIPLYYKDVFVDIYTIMPNHVHLILIIENRPDNADCMVSTTGKNISYVVSHLKGLATKMIGRSIWQRSFHDHILQNERQYGAAWEYIANNPLKWQEDTYYSRAQ